MTKPGLAPRLISERSGQSVAQMSKYAIPASPAGRQSLSKRMRLFESLRCLGYQIR
jgi:hypothetical protein